MRVLTKRFYLKMSDCNISPEILKDLFSNEEYAEKLANALCIRYAFNWITHADVDFIFEEPTTYDLPTERITKWKNHCQSIYELTKDRYSNLLKLYEDQKDNLMKQLSSTSTNKFNDTPQNEGDYSTDNYTSTISKTTVNSDNADTMVRLDEIYKAYRNLLSEWVREFEPIYGGETV